jgi:predicted glycoside hydrolase/deacetylase ChbG (UPF0249 family)
MGARRLIVNADGFGFGAGATQGILDALAGGGPITSISVNANFPDAERVRELVERYPGVSVGVHVNPIVGVPCLSAARVPSLVGEDGSFLGRAFGRLWRRKRISPTELEAELDAQIAKIRDLVGDRLTHLDSHQNSHLGYFELFLGLARKWGIPAMRTNASAIGLEAPRPTLARWKGYARRPHVLAAHFYRRVQMRRAASRGMRMADRLVTVGYGGTGNKAVADNWVRIIRHLPEGTSEVYCHPAYPDETLARWATYTEPRARELEILRRPDLRELARASGVELVSFFDLCGA